eukprot:9292416-Lingulodinium_polyedra.AAC.1
MTRTFASPADRRSSSYTDWSTTLYCDGSRCDSETQARPDLRRLAELRHPGTDHQYMSLITHTRALSSQSNLVKHRLGCLFLAEATVCRVRGGLLDTKCRRA